MKNQHSKRKHSEFAASSSHRWMHCPGSVALVRKAPPQKESPYAIEGTNAHECLEFLVKRFSNLTHAAEDALKKWPAEMVEHGVASAKAIFNLRPSKAAKLYIETRVVLSAIGKNLFGTLDYAWAEPWGDLTVIDYKYGAGVPVLPIDEDNGEPNPQLLYYALGLVYKLGWDFERVRLVIIQPRVWREGEDPVTSATVTIKQLRQFEKKVIAAIEAAKRPDAPLRATPDGCRWCPAAHFCPEVSKAQMDNAGIAFDVEEGITKLPAIEILTPKNLGKVLDACDLLSTWIEKVKAHAFKIACDGEKIEGRKLVPKRSIRSWLPEAEAEAFKKWKDEIFKTEMLSPAQIEKKFGKEAKSFTEEFTTQISSGYSLVPLKDRRQEVSSVIAFDVDNSEE